MLHPYRYTAIAALLLLLAVDYASRANILANANIWFGELGIIETFSAIILLLCCLITLASILGSAGKTKNAYLSRLFLFSFLLFEELSFLSENIFEFTKSYNKQRELNVHNSQILFDPVFGGIDFLGIHFDFSLFTIISISSVFLIAYGGLIFKATWLQPLFSIKELRIFFPLYLLNLAAAGLLRIIGVFSSTDLVLNMEMQEAFLYFVLLLDSISKLLSY